MSRILRRPMFRGGRVDSRGTGIASGLGYEKGGRVGLKKGGGYQFGETGAAKGLGWLNNEFNKMLAAGYDLGAVPINTLGRLFGYNPGFSGTKTLDKWTGGDFTKNNPDLNPDQAWFLNPWGPTSAEEGWTIPSMGGGEAKKVTGITGPPGGGETSRGSEEAYYKEPKVEEKSLEEMMKEMMGPKKTAKEKVAEYKEIFEDAYGSGRGADATAMLLNFAGKALKPEATTKSAFGEFFEEEGKRPSESKKYKDAATTAAINAYLTGEKDYDSLMKQMKLIDYQIEAKTKGATDLKKTWNLNDYIMNKGANTTKMEALEGGIRDKIKLFPEYKTYKKIKSKENVKDLIAEEYVGVIFMDEGTREVFAVVMGEDGPAKQVLY